MADGIKHPCQGARELTIMILTVAGFLTDDRPNEIPDKPAHYSARSHARHVV